MSDIHCCRCSMCFYNNGEVCINHSNLFRNGKLVGDTYGKYIFGMHLSMCSCDGYRPDFETWCEIERCKK